MKIGFFDSGLGGLFLLKKVVKVLPQYDYLFLGDLKHSPYGSCSAQAVQDFTRQGVDYLFKNGCQLIVIACNTATILALRKIQQEYLPTHYPQRRVLGVLVPTLEEVVRQKVKRLGVLATVATVNSAVYIQEIKKLDGKIKIYQNAAPLLVPLVENNGLRWASPVLRQYLNPLLAKKVQAIILGCTHYPILKNKIKKIIGSKIRIISQDDIIPIKLADYLKRHPEIEKKLSKNGKIALEVTDLGADFCQTARKWFGRDIKLKLISI